MKLTLLILFLSFLIIGPTFYFAIHYSDGVVTDGHYEKGIVYDKDRNILKKLNYKINIKRIEKNNDEVILTYILNISDKSLPDKIKVRILRPGDSENIFIEKILRKDNIYKVSFKTKETGHFLVRNYFKFDGQDIIYDKNFYVN
jgi:hypothetical protein